MTATMETQWECQQLMTSFYRGLDERDFDLLLSTLSEDAVWDRLGSILKSHDEIRAAMAVRSKTKVVFHVLTNFQVRQSVADAAHLWAYMICFENDTGADPVFPIRMKAPTSVYVCRGDFARREGQWRMTKTWTEGPYFAAAA